MVEAAADILDRLPVVAHEAAQQVQVFGLTVGGEAGYLAFVPVRLETAEVGHVGIVVAH